MVMKATLRINRDGLRRLAERSPHLYRQGCLRMGQAVESEAVKLVAKPGFLKQPTGALAQSIQTRLSFKRGRPGAIVSATALYARYVHEGTGIYGPMKRQIEPVRAKALMFQVDGRTVFARSVKGMKPRPFFTEAIKRVFPGKVREIWRKVGIEVFR